MNMVYIQLWAYSEIDCLIPDGCSIHKSLDDLERYVSNIYKGREGLSVPESYERTLGIPIPVLIKDGVYNSLLNDGIVILDQPSFRNLLAMEEIVVKC